LNKHERTAENQNASVDYLHPNSSAARFSNWRSQAVILLLRVTHVSFLDKRLRSAMNRLRMYQLVRDGKAQVSACRANHGQTGGNSRLVATGQTTFPEEIFLETCFDNDVLVDAR
jgi:hypothetical protein